MTANLKIDSALVRSLVADQFPQWADLPVRAVRQGGMDNSNVPSRQRVARSHAGREAYAAQVKREQRWLPLLEKQLAVRIPRPIGVGVPGRGYPWHWSINRWIDGEEASVDSVSNFNDFAAEIAGFLLSLHTISASGGPEPGTENFFRGGGLQTYDTQVRAAAAALGGRVNGGLALDVWDSAIRTAWDRAAVWVHGDFAPSNLLVTRGRLCAVIDFGQLAVGDPACDLAIAWTLLRADARVIFREKLDLDPDTWRRGRAWALWKALIVAAGMTAANAVDASRCWQVIADILVDHEQADA